MRNLFKILLVFWAYLAITSCEKADNIGINKKQLDVIAVDGMITNETKAHCVKLTYPATALNQPPNPATGAVVTISDGTNIFSLTENPINSGCYYTDSTVTGRIDSTYQLTIKLNNKVFTAQSKLIATNFFEPLSYTIDSTSKLAIISNVAPSYDQKEWSMWEINLDWSMLPNYSSLPANNCKALLYFYTLPTIDVSEILAPNEEIVKFPIGTVIKEKRYSLNAEYAAYLRSVLLLTTWKGGVFDTAPSNTKTNMSNGAIGFFSACAVISEGLTVK